MVSKPFGDRSSRVSFDTASLMSERVDAEISKRQGVSFEVVGNIKRMFLTLSTQIEYVGVTLS